MPRHRNAKRIPRDAVTRLEEIRNIGPSLAADLRLVGVRGPRDLCGRDPYALFETLCAETAARHDPCVLDAFISAVRFMNGGPSRPWWRYTAERKRTLAAG
jgi:pathogenicity locus Cdd1 protein